MKEETAEQACETAVATEAQSAALARRLNRAFGPIVAGVIIDALDLATFGPIGYVVGLPVGGLAGYWLGRCLGLERKSSLLCALAAGVYCTIPFTGLLPLGTLVGAYVRFRESSCEAPPDETVDFETDAGDDSGGDADVNRVQ